MCLPSIINLWCDFSSKAAVELAGHSWSSAHANIRESLAALFRSATSTIGSWPHCRAVHAVDLMIDTSLQTKVLEVNFCPDFTSPLKRVSAGYPNFINDIFSAMFTDNLPESMISL
jgi:hypothetical protein